MRALVRFSVDGEKNSALRNKLSGALSSAGMVKHPSKTATYESRHILLKDLREALDVFWSKAEAHGGKGSLDHVWIYVDNNPSLHVDKKVKKAKRKEKS